MELTELIKLEDVDGKKIIKITELGKRVLLKTKK